MATVNTTTPTQQNLRALAEGAFVKIDAALPTIQATLESLGDTDAAKSYALARWAIEDAHADLMKIWKGEVA